jgi:hypothetical protein
MSPPRHPVALVLFAVLVLARPGGASAQAPAYSVPDREVMDPPTPGRLESIEQEAAATGWNAMVVPVRSAAVRAYEQDRFAAADAWYHVYRWAALFSEPEDRFISSWADAVTASRLNYEGVSGEYHPTDKPIGLKMSPGLQAWVLSNDAFSEEFFSNLTAVDHLPNVLSILEGLHRRGAEKFNKYSSLALALAVVYDVPPPPFWPHSQVSKESLPRKLPNPYIPYESLIHEDELGRTYFGLSKLRVEELKFVVDAAAPEPELAWSRANVPYALDQFEQVYDMVSYRTDRAESYAKMTWSGTPYTLQAIRAQGGICVDQAYFATEAGKARGVPTLLFTGNGQDGRHAWFGFLDGEHKWRLDAGRYAEQRLVTGNALDPQTWLQISDHELQFLSERFRALPSFMQSRVHEEFAEDFLRAGDPAGAARAARAAVNYERRNVEAWETLIAANRAQGLNPAVQEGVMREAALAFAPKYPDLVLAYENRVTQSLRSRGETSLANFEEQGSALRQIGNRDDLAVLQASKILERSIATQRVPDQIATYNAIIGQYGRGAGTLFFDHIVLAFAEHLAIEHMKPQARDAVERARDALDIQPGTQVAMDADKLMERLQD